MKSYNGIGVCGGSVCGAAFSYRRAEHGPVCAAGTAQEELTRYEAAAEHALESLASLHSAALAGAGGEAAAIFEVHRMMLEDPNFREAVGEGISARGLDASTAVLEAGEQFAAQFEALPDVYLSERAADVRDVARRVADFLSGTAELTRLTAPAVLVADDLTPGETIGLDSEKLLGLVLRGGSTHSHTAVLARALNVPAVFGVGAAFPAPEDGRPVLVDGTAGAVFVEPDEPTLAAYKERLAARAEEKHRLEALAGAECVTLDGERVLLLANVGSAAEVGAAVLAGAAGIGLFRSEYLFLDRASLPTEEEQLVAYRAALEAAGGRRVTIRTLDIGADKQAPCLALPQEENPALGCRALRLCLARPELLQTQLCALYRASMFGSLAIMFPMLTSEWELDAALAAAAEARAALEARGEAFHASVPLGMMVETPAAALLSAQFAKKAAFFSIGTNDLTQYTLAADRQNPATARYYNQQHHAVLSLISLTVENAARCGVPVAVCGELASQPASVPLLLALGVRELSAPPALLPALLEAVRQTDVSAVRAATRAEPL